MCSNDCPDTPGTSGRTRNTPSTIDATTTHWVFDIVGQRGEFSATITKQHPDERVAWKSDVSPDHAGVVTFHRLDDTHTRVTAQMDIDPDGVVENVADKFGVLTHWVKADMQNHATSTVAWVSGTPRGPHAATPSTHRSVSTARRESPERSRRPAAAAAPPTDRRLHRPPRPLTGCHRATPPAPASRRCAPGCRATPSDPPPPATSSS
ncbi:hypothetical protein SAMN04490239_0938 [Rhodococcus koreensis]|uniref:Coenzyme Q-binding protein COQ10 START domain-containing protein n=1 Tax=Rhodococcus koreensis TaxID=99653 RepID=A0A1H4KWL9_9NOCA|nr:hypothetical protein SAMN04490239_0938 [Rhodococcus koreensis]